MDFRLALGAALLLGACSGNPMDDAGSGGGGGGGGGLIENPIPEELARNVNRISFDAETDTLTVDVYALDDDPAVVTYQRNAALDVPGYRAFTVQDDPLDRMFVAMTAESADGSVEAAAISDGGQFNRYFSGTYYKRNSGRAPAPTTGQVSYAGTYAGITNLNAAGDNLLPVPPGTPDEAIPGEPLRTRGSAFLNVNFADSEHGVVNGTIYNRQFVGGAGLPSLALIAGDVDENGEFMGDVEFAGLPDEGTQGTYGGIFGGTNGSAVAGVVVLDNLFLPDDPREEVTKDFDAEVGVFVLPRCNQPGAPAICDNVRP
jgi:hypothetical protein